MAIVDTLQTAAQVLLEVLLILVNIVWLWAVSIYKAVVPMQFQAQKDVRGKVVLITGAGSGIGRLLSVRFASLGAKLVLWDVNEKGNKETENMLKIFGSNVWTYTVDLSVRTNVYEVAEKVKRDVGDVDILINNAGIVTGKKFLDSPDALIEKTMAVNVHAHFWTVKSFLPKMMEKNSGHIVSIASSAGLFGVCGLADYCASKFAAVGFDESLRFEMEKLGKTGIHTTVVCPFFINTGMFQGAKTYADFILPMLEPEYVAEKIVEAILTDQKILMIPKSVYLFYLMKGLLPSNVIHVVNRKMRISDFMDGFVGRTKEE